MKQQFTYIDLFAGAGGLSEGFLQEDFIPVAHIEKNKDSCETIKTRMLFHFLKKEGKLDIYYDYLLKKISKSDFYFHLPEIFTNSIINEEISETSLTSIFEKIPQKDVDIIVGGPPCQAYSIIGRARIRDEKQKTNDPRRFLYKLYIEFLKKYKPKIFVFENVPGVLSAKNEDGSLLIDTMESEFLAAGYLMDRQIVDASDFGVLQKRQRVIIIGWQKKLPISPPVFAKVPIRATNVMNDLLADLPPIEPNKNEPFLDYIKSPSKYLVDFNLRIPKEPLTLHFARFINANDSQIYKIAIETLFNTGKQLSYKDLPQNLKTQKNEKSFLDRFCVIRGNSSTTYTMVAHIAKDGHHYIYPDATLQQIRSISVREAARIQSFPDNYFFEGARGAMFTQIGNAVPPLVAQAIAKTIKQILWKL